MVCACDRFAVSSRLWLPLIRQEVMEVVVKTIRIPEEANTKLMLLSRSMNIDAETWMVFAIIRCLEVWGWMFKLWR